MSDLDSSEDEDIVTLEVEGSLIQCSRTILSHNSDYFKAMFEGGFLESQKRQISLKDVNLAALNKLLKLLWDKEYIMGPEDLLAVLQLACMLQFVEIKIICEDRLLSILSASNCLKMWFQTEHLALKQVYLRAKLVAFLDFMLVKDNQSFIELSLSELCTYLGSVYLQTSSEIVVFESFMDWCCRNEEFSTDTLLQLLHCLNFNEISNDDIHKMMSDIIIKKDKTVLSVLMRILQIRDSGSIEDTTPQPDAQTASSLLKSKNRNTQGFPCLLVDNLGIINENVVEKNSVFYYDKFKRKTKYEVLDSSLDSDLSVIGFDHLLNKFHKLVDVESQKFRNLDGFKTVGHKQYLFMLGGETFLGKGDWNSNFLQYDTVNDVWREKPKFPFNRRHFESWVCGNYLYVVGGTGSFRIIQENMFWYSIEEEKWCKKQTDLPCSGRQIKCCCFNESLLILNINNRVAYLFKHEDAKWLTYDIEDKVDRLPSYSQSLSVFSYRKNLFIKDKNLIQLTLMKNKFVITKVINLSTAQIDAVESVICNNILYSLSRRKNDDESDIKITLEAFNMDTSESSVLMSKTNNDILEVNNELFKLKHTLNIFNIFHHCLLSDNVLVNNC